MKQGKTKKNALIGPESTYSREYFHIKSIILEDFRIPRQGLFHIYNFCKMGHFQGVATCKFEKLFTQRLLNEKTPKFFPGTNNQQYCC